MWWFLIGMFLRNAANSSYQQLLVRDALRGEPITKFMKSEVISISPEATVEDLVDHYVYKYHFKTYPVIENGELAGCVSLSQIKAIPKEQWATTKIRQLLTVCTDLNSIGEQADAMDALTKMSQVQVSRLLVLDGSGHLEGIVSLKDMLSYISMKMELEHVR
jgi:predicted transcriptional regulator